MKLGHCRFFTLTSPGNEDGPTSYAQFPARWKRFHMRLERRFGRIEYLGVVEPQKRGAAHIHVVYRGPYISQGWLSRVAAECGFGKIADIRRANPRLIRYLAKYLAKDLAVANAQPEPEASDERPDAAAEAERNREAIECAQNTRLPRHFRRVRWSRSWCAWEKRTRAMRWTKWWIADAVPIHAAIDAAHRGFTVKEVIADNWAAKFDLRRPIQWLRDLVGYRAYAPLNLATG
jgi:hypothetical protein